MNDDEQVPIISPATYQISVGTVPDQIVVDRRTAGHIRAYFDYERINQHLQARI
jgi:hypothetical protein